MRVYVCARTTAPTCCSISRTTPSGTGSVFGVLTTATQSRAFSALVPRRNSDAPCRASTPVSTAVSSPVSTAVSTLRGYPLMAADAESLHEEVVEAVPDGLLSLHVPIMYTYRDSYI